jgi:broad specificity phosphatase PhoE
VRHGQTDWNLEGRFAGQTDVPLNQAGRAEAQSLAGRLSGYSFEVIHTSDLNRSMETAEIIAEVLHLPIMPEPGLREINQGEWEGQFVEDIKTKNAGLWEQRMIDPANFHPPGGESIAEVDERVHAAVRKIAQSYPSGAGLIVSHGLALATIICRAHDIPVEKAFNHIPENAVPIWVDWME